MLGTSRHHEKQWHPIQLFFCIHVYIGEEDAWLVSWHLRLTSLATFSIVFVKAKQEISSVLFSGRTLPMVSFSVGLDIKTSKKLFGADPCLTCLINYQRIWPRSNSRKGKPLKFQLYVTCSALHNGAKMHRFMQLNLTKVQQLHVETTAWCLVLGRSHTLCVQYLLAATSLVWFGALHNCVICKRVH